MLRSCFHNCFGRRSRDGLLWQVELKPHASGEFSMAVVQANTRLEDQSQVLTSPVSTYVGVYDGHGGSEASRFVSQHLFPHLERFSAQRGGLSQDVIKMAFNATEEDFTNVVKRTMAVKPQMATVGTCGLFGAITDGELYVANLGDSRAVLGRRGFDGERKFVAERLSVDHNVSCEDVRREVEAVHHDDLPVVIFCRGVWRIKGIIQVSRSIGDIYLKRPFCSTREGAEYQQYAGYVPMKRPLLSAEPTIVTRKLRPHDLFVIFASDGLWEQLSDDEAIQMVSKYPRAGIAQRLITAAIQIAAKKRELHYKDIKRIEKGSRRHFHDDISVVVIYLDHHGTSSNSTHRQVAFGCTNAPVDIFSYNSDDAVESSGDKIFPNEEIESDSAAIIGRRKG